MENHQLSEWAKTLRVTAGYEDQGQAIIELLEREADQEETLEALENALGTSVSDLDEIDDPVARVEHVLARYSHVREVFNVREEFDLSGDDYQTQLVGVLAQGDKALSFKWKVMGILRETGAIGPGKTTMNDDALLSILKMMMP